LAETRRLHDNEAAVDLGDLWTGTLEDPFASATVTGTAALALWTVHAAPDMAAAQALADDLWANRRVTEGVQA